MDTTPEYIKQCKGAFSSIGFIDAGELTNLFFDDDSYWHGFSPDGRNDKPLGQLYRQDQLQEIWRREYLKRPSKYGWFGEFCNFIGDVYSDYDLMNADEVFESMEQLWLAFVMKELYGKVWNGEEWVRA